VHPLDHRAQRGDHRLHLVVKISAQLARYALIATEPTKTITSRWFEDSSLSTGVNTTISLK
jgi:hypothetical protein